MIGRQIGPYTLLTELGSGGMGTVYLAEGPAEGGGRRRVALKVIHPHLLAAEGFFKRFLREAEIGKRVDHPNVVRTLDVDATSIDGVQHHFLVMEHVEGQTLRELLAEMERVPEELCRHIGREVARALEAIHAAGVVHRDLKPENVLITGDHTVKVMDLGIAHLVDQTIQTSKATGFVGSVLYAAPEQFSNEPPDPAGDWYALGLILYELATGQHPSQADDLAGIMRMRLDEEPRPAGQINPQLSPYFEEVIHALLRTEKAERLAGFPDEGSDWWRDRSRAIRAETRRPLRRIRIPRDTAVYGRDEEMERLHAIFEAAKSGDGRAMLIQGEAGIGKSRLVDELAGRLQQRGEDFNFLFGSYPPGGGAGAASGLAMAYGEHLGEGGVAVYLPQTPLLAPAFDALLRGEPPPDGALGLDRDALATCFVHVTRNLAAERPTVVLLDDLHFATDESRDLFLALALAAPGHRILLVGTSRPGLPEDWLANLARLNHVSQLRLDRLGPKDLGALLKDSFKSQQLAEQLAFQIGAKSDGNPFFVFEIIRSLREGRSIARQDDGTWVSTRVIDRIEIPSSVRDLVNARVAELSEPERDLLDVASCWGFEFDPGLVAAALETPLLPTLKRFGQIERRHRLVRAAGRRYAFDHHQVHEALYGSLFEQVREMYHARLAEALEAREGAAAREPATLPGNLCVDLCEHFLQGAQGERALRYLDAALGHLESAYRNDAAADLCERALAVPDLLAGVERSQLLLRLAWRLDSLGHRERQIAACEEAERIAHAVGDEAEAGRAARALGVTFEHIAEHAAAEKALRRALDLAQRHGNRKDEAEATGSLGIVCSSLNRFDEAKAHHERHLAIARETGDRRAEATATGNMGTVLVKQGHLEEACAHHERHLALAREIGELDSEARATGNLGNTMWLRGRFEEAEELCTRGLELARQCGNRRSEAIALGNLGAVFSILGRLDEAGEHYERHRAIAREIGDRRGEVRATGNLATIFWAQGRLAEAKAQCERHLEFAREIGDPQGEAAGLMNLAACAALLGRTDEARARNEEALEVARKAGHRAMEASALAALGTLCGDAGEGVAAVERLEAALSLTRDMGDRAGTATTLLALARLNREAGRTELARKEIAEARAMADAVGVPATRLLAACHAALLEGGDAAPAEVLLRELGARINCLDLAEARFLLYRATGKREHLAEAHRLLVHLRDHAPPECRDAMVAHVPLHRAIAEAWGEG